MSKAGRVQRHLDEPRRGVDRGDEGRAVRGVEGVARPQPVGVDEHRTYILELVVVCAIEEVVHAGELRAQSAAKGVGVVDNDLDGVPLATGRSAPQAIAAAPRHRAVAPDPSIRTEGLYYNILYDTVKQMRKKQNFSAIDVENELPEWAKDISDLTNSGRFDFLSVRAGPTMHVPAQERGGCGDRPPHANVAQKDLRDQNTLPPSGSVVGRRT